MASQPRTGGGSAPGPQDSQAAKQTTYEQVDD
jgi:hypothetical protein